MQAIYWNSCLAENVLITAVQCGVVDLRRLRVEYGCWAGLLFKGQRQALVIRRTHVLSEVMDLQQESIAFEGEVADGSGKRDVLSE